MTDGCLTVPSHSAWTALVDDSVCEQKETGLKQTSGVVGDTLYSSNDFPSGRNDPMQNTGSDDYLLPELSIQATEFQPTSTDFPSGDGVSASNFRWSNSRS